MSNPFSRLLRLLPPASRQERLQAEQRLTNLPGLKHSWSMLLSAHGRFHELARDASRVVHGASFISMVYVRSACTSLFVNAFAVLRHLREISERNHKDLEQALQNLRSRVDEHITPAPSVKTRELTLPLSAVDMGKSRFVGTKMAHLGEIKQRFKDLRVPDGFVITAAAFDVFLDENDLRDEINRRLQTQIVRDTADMFRLSSELQLLIINAPLPEKLQNAIHAAYRELEARAGHRGVRVAMRSSAVGEDERETSFAGQHRTELNVSEELLFTAYKEVLASKYSLTAMNYRFARGFKDEDMPMCVGCVIMVNTASAGVMYTQDPMSADSETMHVNAVHGMAKAISDGYVAPDHWAVAKSPTPSITARTIRPKDQKFVTFLSEEGVALLPTTTAQRSQPALDDDQVLEICSVGMLLEQAFKGPLDVEWAVTKSGELFILQSRPLKRVCSEPKPRLRGVPETKPHFLIQGGEAASPGFAAGPVFVVKTNNDLLHFPNGAVLVTSRPHPRWSALLPRAVAIITETGGGTFGHLANIAREFGIPAVFGVKQAGAQLRNNDLIAVDADNLIIAPATPDEVAAFHGTRRSSLRDTPVFTSLAEILGQVLGLTKINPLDPRLDPDQVKTLQDMIHACQLQASREMLKTTYAPGVLHPLAVFHPANWWVLDLDDQCLQEPGQERDKSPRPMPCEAHPLVKAVWQGIVVHPWTMFTNSPRRSRVLRLLRRLHAAVRPLSPPRPRVFLVSRHSLQLYVALERAFFLLQAHIQDNGQEQLTSLLWQWFAPFVPEDAWLTQTIHLLRGQGFFVDLAEDGIFIWAVGDAADDHIKRLKLLAYLLGALQSSPEPLAIPQEFRIVPAGAHPMDDSSPLPR